MSSTRPVALIVLAGVLVVVSACASPTETESPPPPTPGVTVIVPSTPLPQVTDTPLPAEAATDVVLTPEPSPTEPCSNDATFLDDLTVPDDTVFLPGDPIDKRWSIQNTGTCDWNGDYRLVNTNEETLGAPSEIALYPARSGAVATLQAVMTAPQTPGDYVSRWQARTPEGNLFGATVFIRIRVEAPTATPGP